MARRLPHFQTLQPALPDANDVVSNTWLATDVFNTGGKQVIKHNSAGVGGHRTEFH